MDARILNLPLTPYEKVYDLQRAAVAARISGRLAAELVILVEHPSVFTLGRRGGLKNLTVDPAFVAHKGIRTLPTERGGSITYHGPGQLLAYPIFNISAARISVVDYVAALETAMVRTAGHWGVAAKGNPAIRGAWVGRRKLGSIGITVRQGVAFHGLALNVNTDLTPFAWIDPCGIKDCEITSLAREVGRKVSMHQARDQMQRHLIGLLDLDCQEVDIDFMHDLQN